MVTHIFFIRCSFIYVHTIFSFLRGDFFAFPIKAVEGQNNSCCILSVKKGKAKNDKFFYIVALNLKSVFPLLQCKKEEWSCVLLTIKSGILSVRNQVNLKNHVFISQNLTQPLTHESIGQVDRFKSKRKYFFVTY